MKKKIIYLSVILVLVISVITLSSIYKSKDNKYKKEYNTIPKEMAIMIKEEGATDYTKSTSKDIPKGNYVLNRDKSYCKNNGVIGDYDNNLGKISFSFIGTDSCYLYFDVITDTEKPVISNLVVNDTTITATLTDNESLSGYGISTSNSVEPTSWTSINGKRYNLSTTISTEGTYYLWVKDSAGNKTTKEFTISLGTSFETLMVANNSDIFEENGLRYEGSNPNNYICLDNKTSGTCSDSSLLFRIIGLFDEDTSSDGTSSSGTKKLLKIIDTNNYGGTDGKYWNYEGTNNWSTALLKTELNYQYLRILLDTIGVNSKLNDAIVKAKWHLGGASSSNYETLTAEGIYTEERNTSAIYSGNPSSIYAQVGLMYPSDYGYATVGGTTTNRAGCREEAVYYYDTADCKNNDWLFTSQSSFVNSGEWLLSPYSSNSTSAALLNPSGYVDLSSDYGVGSVYAVRPAFYLDSSVLKIVGTGDGTKDNAYRLG